MSDPLATLMAGAKASPGGGPEATAGDSDEVDAARDLIDAVKAGDAKAVSLALSRHYELCEAKDEGDEGPASEGEGEAGSYAEGG